MAPKKTDEKNLPKVLTESGEKHEGSSTIPPKDEKDRPEVCAESDKKHEGTSTVPSKVIDAKNLPNVLDECSLKMKGCWTIPTDAINDSNLFKLNSESNEKQEGSSTMPSKVTDEKIHTKKHDRRGKKHKETATRPRKVTGNKILAKVNTESGEGCSTTPAEVTKKPPQKTNSKHHTLLAAYTKIFLKLFDLPLIPTRLADGIRKNFLHWAALVNIINLEILPVVRNNDREGKMFLQSLIREINRVLPLPRRTLTNRGLLEEEYWVMLAAIINRVIISEMRAGSLPAIPA